LILARSGATSGADSLYQVSAAAPIPDVVAARQGAGLLDLWGKSHGRGKVAA
jgi:hypothetical protein